MLDVVFVNADSLKGAYQELSNKYSAIERLLSTTSC